MQLILLSREWQHLFHSKKRTSNSESFMFVSCSFSGYEPALALPKNLEDEQSMRVVFNELFNHWWNFIGAPSAYSIASSTGAMYSLFHLKSKDEINLDIKTYLSTGMSASVWRLMKPNLTLLQFPMVEFFSKRWPISNLNEMCCSSISSQSLKPTS